MNPLPALVRGMVKPKAAAKPQRMARPNFLPVDSGDGTNGLVLQGYYLPEEILRLILSFVDDKCLLKYRLVCKYWRYVIDNEVWKFKIRRDQYSDVPVAAINIISNTTNSWLDFYPIVVKKPFGRNLVKNCSGQDKFAHWEILSEGGDKWAVENPPAGSENLPEEALEDGTPYWCFVTSFHSCSKCQTIELEEAGVTPWIMDILQPTIKICEWYARRWDCGAVYEMKVELLDGRLQPLKDFEHRVTMDGCFGNDWHTVSHEFINYGPGVRYVMFYHGGTDTQFWAGHYGSKMAGASVVLELNSEMYNTVSAPSPSAPPEDDSESQNASE